MKYYFAWVDEDSTFSPEIHLREDEKIFSLQIFEEEGHVPYARLILENSQIKEKKVSECLQPYQKSYCFIAVKVSSGDIKLLFRGRLVNCPTHVKGELITLDFISLSSIREENYGVLLNDLKTGATWDTLFLPLSQRDNPPIEDLLASQNSLPYWDRISHEVALSSLIEGRQKEHIKGRYYRDSLKLGLNNSPLEEIEVHLHGKWVQRFEGKTCFDHLLQRDLPEGVIKTYSGLDLEKKWWEPDQNFRPHGYRVSESSLVSMTNYDQIDRFWISPQDPLLHKKRGRRPLQKKEPQKARFKCKAYRPSLSLEWRYIQPRHEEVIFTLKQDFQPLSYKPSKRKILQLTVHDLVAGEELAHWGADLYYKRGERLEHQGYIYRARRSHRSGLTFEEGQAEWETLGAVKTYPLQHHRGTFFQTDRGRAIVEHALDRARAYLCASSRCIEISFICPLEEALDWSCDHSISLEDDRLPGGEATGKVKKLTFEVIGDTGRMRAYVTLGCCVGTDREVPLETLTLKDEIAYAASDVLEDKSSGNYGRTQSGIDYRYGSIEGGERGILYPALLGASDLLREFSISYDAKQQGEILQAHQYPKSHNILENFKGCTTKVKLRLEDLRGRRLEKTTLFLEVPTPWSAPQQINLGSQ